MHTRLNQSVRDDAGFTLIELLVVILIIGILAAIAIPSFIGQKNKANDAAAKELARSGQTTAETIATDNNGSYASVSVSNLGSYEPSLKTTCPSSLGACLSTATGTASGYTIVTSATNGDLYTVANTAGTITRQCQVATGANKLQSACPSGSW